MRKAAFVFLRGASIVQPVVPIFIDCDIDPRVTPVEPNHLVIPYLNDFDDGFLAKKKVARMLVGDGDVEEYHVYDLKYHMHSRRVFCIDSKEDITAKLREPRQAKRKKKDPIDALLADFGQATAPKKRNAAATGPLLRRLRRKTRVAPLLAMILRNWVTMAMGAVASMMESMVVAVEAMVVMVMDRCRHLSVAAAAEQGVGDMGEAAFQLQRRVAALGAGAAEVTEMTRVARQTICSI